MPRLLADGTGRVCQIVGKMLYHTMGVDNNLLMDLNAITAQQENVMDRMVALVNHQLN